MNPAEGRMRTPLVVSLLVRGGLGLVAGLAVAGLQVFTALFPRTTAGTVLQLFGGFVLLDGLITLGASLTRSTPSDLWLRAQGGIGVAAGIVLVGSLQAMAPWVLFVIALWAIAAGVIELLVAGEMRRQYGVGTLTVSGVTSILFGLGSLAARLGTLMGFVWLQAIYLIVVGIARIAAALR
ncbi:MAG TPA: DUF308 domain-containing protein [Candidatus Methylomirabilis sp.]|nr:DUF308 domain-containing protein [Candidatus Methylomirabilis sp.]